MDSGPCHADYLPGLEQSDMKKTLKKSPVIAFAEVLCQRAVEICSAANNGEDPEIIIKAWDGSFEEEIERGIRNG